MRENLRRYQEWVGKGEPVSDQGKGGKGEPVSDQGKGDKGKGDQAPSWRRSRKGDKGGKSDPVSDQGKDRSQWPRAKSWGRSSGWGSDYWGW